MDIQDLTTRQVANALVVFAAALPYGAAAVRAALMTAADESSFLRYANNGTSTRIDVLTAYGGRQNFQDAIRVSLTFSHDADAPDLASAATGKDTTADSVGMFQQRPMYGYGSIADLMDPAESTRIFIRGVPGDPMKVKHWLREDKPAGLTIAQAAQWIQGSEFPDGIAYAPMETVADQLIAHFGGIPTQGEWLDMVTKDEFTSGLNDVLGGVKGNTADSQARLRGSDTDKGQEHEHYDMLEGINAAVNRMEGVVNNLRSYVVGGYSGATMNDSNIAGIWYKVTDLDAKVDALAKLVATLVK